jgi:hypothetical protein
MAKFTNFMNPNLTRPQGERAWYSNPRTQLFEATSVNALQTLINDWIVDLALPVQALVWYDLRDIKYSSAQESNNIVSYSALALYDIWLPQ